VFHARNRVVCAPLCFALFRTDEHAGENVRDRFSIPLEYSTGLLRFRGIQILSAGFELGERRQLRCIV
jgi:hypothetical protein